ncbi:hypothetical protein FPV67DRAFT_1678289 [Lyophyllum atratum]|nr:hypothetical protein FPV67DRAFT_1678289 [Lyophyllum atratum]
MYQAKPHPPPETDRYDDPPLDSKPSRKAKKVKAADTTMIIDSADPTTSQPSYSQTETMSAPGETSGSASIDDIEMRTPDDHGSDLESNTGAQEGVQVPFTCEVDTSLWDASSDDSGPGSPPLTDGEGGSETEDEQDLEDVSPNLRIPADLAKTIRQQLAQLNLYVDPLYNRIICLVCSSLVQFASIHAHALTHARGTQRLVASHCRLPDKDALEQLLKQLQADHPVKLPSYPIPPFPGIAVVDGIKCCYPSCSKGQPIFSDKRRFNEHCASIHPHCKIEDRLSSVVPSQALSLSRRQRVFVEVTHAPQAKMDAFLDIMAHSKSIGLGELPATYTPTINTHARNIIFMRTEWDSLLTGVDLRQLRISALSAKEDDPALFRMIKLTRRYYDEVMMRLPEISVLTRRLIRSPETHTIDPKPFGKPQEGTTIIHYADYVSNFLAFLVRHVLHSMTTFQVPLHPNVTENLVVLHQLLADESSPDADIHKAIHRSVWSIVSLPSQELMLRERDDPFTRFLLANHLKDDYGTIKSLREFPHNINRFQWGIRASACCEILRQMTITGRSDYSCYVEFVKPFLHDGEVHTFNTLRQNMKLFTTLAKQQPGIPKFGWDVQKTVLSINGFPLQLSVFYKSITTGLERLETLIIELLRGCPYEDLLKEIDSRLDPDPARAAHWYRDQPLKDTMCWSIFKESSNGFDKYQDVLLHHLSCDTQLLHSVNGATVGTAKLWGWFGLLDEIMGLMFVLASTTWGGGARGTECDDLKFANNKDGGRNVFLFNNILTFAPSYDKNVNIHGGGRRVAHAPAFQVSRLLMLVTGFIYPAAYHLAPLCGMDVASAENYATHVFVQHGKVMKTDQFTKALSLFTRQNFGLAMGVRDWRQVMCTIMVNIGHIDFGLPDAEDEDLRAIHESYNHNSETGGDHYALQISNSLPQFSHTAIASDQRVCFRWHACIGQLHPSIAHQLKDRNMGTDASRHAMFDDLETFLPHILNPVKEELEKSMDKLTTTLIDRLDSGFEAVGSFIASVVTKDAGGKSGSNTQASRNHSIMVHPKLLLRLAPLLDYGRQPKWSCPEQAEVIQACQTGKHVIAILPTGSGKTFAFLASALLNPEALYIVVLPLKALVQDMYRRIVSANIDGGIYPEVDGAKSRIVLVSAEHAGSERFLQFSRASGYRLKRIFVDEAHHTYTSDYRMCFNLFKYLTSLGKPITFLSATIFPHSVDLLCFKMRIPRDIVHEIRAPNVRKNIQYTVEHVLESAEIPERIHRLITSIALHQESRGLIYCKNACDARALSKTLGFAFYVSDIIGDVGGLSVDEKQRENDKIKANRTSVWWEGRQPEDRWMIATMCFGQGIDYPKVRHVIHYEVRGILYFVQEVGRAGRDGNLAQSTLFWSRKPTIFEDSQEGGDHTGLIAMGEFLTTHTCRLLAFAPVNGVSYSCASLDGAPLCDNCAAASLAPGNDIHTSDHLRFDAPLASLPPTRPVQSQTTTIATHSRSVVPSRGNTARIRRKSNDTAQQRPVNQAIPRLLSVATNGELVAQEIQAGADSMGELKAAIDQIVAVGCADCWVQGNLQPPEPHVHKRSPYYKVWNDIIRKGRFHDREFWPVCYICWIPFRGDFGHKVFGRGELANTDYCPHHTTIPSIIPTVITLIAAHRPGIANPHLYVISQRVGVKVEDWDTPSKLWTWLAMEPTSHAQIPNPARFITEFYRACRKLSNVAAVQVMDVDS